MNSAIVDYIEKVSPLSGVVAVALVVYGFVLIKPMDYFPTPERAAEIFNQNPGQLYRGALVGGFYGVVFLLWFASVVFKRLSQGINGESFIPALALVGGIILAVGIMTANGLFWVAADRVRRTGGMRPESAVIYYDLIQIFLSNVITIGLMMLIGATGLGSLQTHLFPVWLGWISVILAIGLLTPFHYVFEVLGLIWVLAASILLF
jgi:hypothetical protein